jgi:hypothetical protein
MQHFAKILVLIASNFKILLIILHILPFCQAELETKHVPCYNKHVSKLHRKQKLHKSKAVAFEKQTK